ncbi:MAG: tRNA pseudouridine(54/55) synthase Pus10 [Candidatus Korarchaeota archaeon]
MIESARKLLERNSLCDECLGRFFALKGSGLSNSERGFSLKAILLMEYSDDNDLVKRLAESGFAPARNLAKRRNLQFGYHECELCRGIFNSIDELTNKGIEIARGIEYDSFLVGITGDSEIEEMQESIASTLSIATFESFRNNLSRVLGKTLSSKLGKPVSQNPDIVFIFDLSKRDIKLQINPLYIEGRYKKYVRNIQQTSTCSACKGKGCNECNGTGLDRCVEREIVLPLYELTGATKVIMHAAGREDKNVRMLGTGRPFIVEIKNPRKRKFDYEEWIRRVNNSGAVEILSIMRTTRSRLIEMKRAGENARKEYVGIAEISRDISQDDIALLERTFTNSIVSQYTPTRVLRERGNILRKKKVYWLKLEPISPNRIKFHIGTDGGLYVKELITGDNGRTSPSFAEVLGAEAKCIELDVIAVIEQRKGDDEYKHLVSETEDKKN